MKIASISTPESGRDQALRARLKERWLVCMYVCMCVCMYMVGVYVFYVSMGVGRLGVATTRRAKAR